MDIVVCVKQILDTTDIKFDPETGWLKREGKPTIINSLDEYAIEEALRLKEAHGGKVTILGMGPASAQDALKHGVAMGADEAVIITDDALQGSDTIATSRALANAIAKMDNVDLVICGAETVDGNTAYVGPGVASLLQVPFVAFVNNIEEIGDGKMTVRRMMEEGYDRLECPTPALITVVKGINEPRISSLKGKMKAKKTKPQVLAIGDLGLDASKAGQAGSTSKVVRTFPPEPRPAGVMIEGEPDEIAEKLFQHLR